MTPRGHDERFDPEHCSARELARAIGEGQISAREACEAAIARIEARDGEINAVVVRDFERAREQASERDARRARGERPALLGVPMTVKESIDIAGLPTTWGIAPFREHRANEDAVLVQRLKAAGAVILGKTNVPVALADWQTVNPIYGRTLNPIDPARSPGGSSGGSAAALAAGMVAIEVGSDIGGSLRVPAAFCGVFAHKPTFGLVPSRGHGFPGSDGAGVELAVVGPMARHPADLELELGIIAGPDLDAATGYRLDLPPPRARDLAGARLLFLDRHPAASTSSVLTEHVGRVADVAARAGAEVCRESELLPDLGAAHAAYSEMLGAIFTRGSPNAKNVISAHRWMELLDAQFRLRRQWRALFDRFDAVVTPAFGTVAYPHVENPNEPGATLSIDGKRTPYFEQLAWPGVATFPGLPATAVPVGATSERLPVGLQVIAGALHDRTAIAIGTWLSRREP
ncbi:MAG TPA: amidase family protein [Caldimonas sp.]|jgi:amidase|nr:amidase family protein [Caldimonas sp.]